MKISEIENRAYQWRGKDGGWQVGRPLMVDGEIIRKLFMSANSQKDVIAMQPQPTGEAVWVRLNDLQPYPSEPIEEPRVKGGG